MNSAFEIACMAAVIAALGSGVMAEVVRIDYDASGVPDGPAWQGIFSTQLVGSTGWGASGSELTMSNPVGGAHQVIWFGNHPTHDPVPWDLGAPEVGNFLSVRAKLAAGSEHWHAYVIDGDYQAMWGLMDGYVNYSTDAVNRGVYVLDTSQYHTYSFRLANGQVTYWVDGNHISTSAADPAPGSPDYLVIGDGSFTAPTGVGTMIVDHVTIITPEPATLTLLALGGLTVLRRRRK